MNFIFYKLPQSIFMHVNTTGLTMMYFTFHNCWICTSFYFKSCDAIVMNIILFKISLKYRQNKNLNFVFLGKSSNKYHSIIKSKNANVSAMVNMIFSHNRTRKIFNPNTSQCIPTDFVVFISAMGIISYI